jgi:hypothetical protein
VKTLFLYVLQLRALKNRIQCGSCLEAVERNWSEDRAYCRLLPLKFIATAHTRRDLRIVSYCVIDTYLSLVLPFVKSLRNANDHELAA